MGRRDDATSGANKSGVGEVIHIHTTDNKAPDEKGDDNMAKAVGSALDEHINLEVLTKLKSAFHKADADGGGDLSIEEFVAAFADMYDGDAPSRTRKGIDNAKLRQLFTRIDANADGTVDWNEFSTYVLLENQAGPTGAQQTF